ncbi:hypothetical protein TIFTF001_007968 [Ficus carica]|uniref:Uncharacterized protein n=1 Tax=Ficus carica TaxID=3494 RepID=A0AA88DGR5_FICCA|nr:hypothetical protein TIFTF001_007968 [Ficus carica]
MRLSMVLTYLLITLVMAYCMLNASVGRAPSKGCGSTMPEWTMKGDNEWIETPIEVIWMEGIESRMISRLLGCSCLSSRVNGSNVVLGHGGSSCRVVDVHNINRRPHVNVVAVRMGKIEIGNA